MTSMSFEVLRASAASERQRWLAAVAELPDARRDVYFQPEYLQPFEEPGIEACCAVFKSGPALLLYPFMRSEIRLMREKSAGRPHADIQSPYGYGGPVVNVAGESQEFRKPAWSLFGDWCMAEGLVSDFVRFHPLIENERWAPEEMKVFKDRDTVPIVLDTYATGLNNSSYYRAHRQMLSKAERSGFSFHTMALQSELSWFVPLYLETQSFLCAPASTRFGDGYFDSVARGFGERAWLGVIRHADQITAAVLVLEGPTYVHSHLMGYRRDIPTAGMTNLLYHGVALQGAQRGKRMLHMGGGRTSSSDDSLLAFKKSLSPELKSFCLGTRCYNESLYEEAGRCWEDRHGSRPKNYLQFYHLPGSTPTVS